MKSILMGMVGFGRIAINIPSFDFFHTYYSEETSQFAPIFLSLSYSLYGLMQYPVNILLNGNFNNCVLFDGIPTFLVSLLFCHQVQFIQPDHDVKDRFHSDLINQTHCNPISFIFRQAFSLLNGKTKYIFLIAIINSIYIYTLSTSVYFLSEYFSNPIQIITLLNITVGISTLLSGPIQVKFNVRNTYSFFFLVSILINLSIVFISPSQSNNQLSYVLLLANCLINTFINNLQQLQFIILIPWFFSMKFNGFFVHFGTLIARLILIKLPEFQYELKANYDYYVMPIYGLCSFLILTLNFLFMRKKLNDQFPEKYDHLQQLSIIQQSVVIKSIQMSHYSNNQTQHYQNSLLNKKGLEQSMLIQLSNRKINNQIDVIIQ